MLCSFLQIPPEDGFLAVESEDNFDGLKVFPSIQQLMPPIGTYDRVVFDFSGISGITPLEIYQMSNEMAYDPHFRNVEISIVNFRLESAQKMDAVDNLGVTASER